MKKIDSIEEHEKQESLEMPFSSQVEVEYAELHTPLFLAGTNFGTKLDRRDHKRRDLVLVFDEDKKRLIVTFNKKVAQVPEAAVAYWIEGKVENLKPIHNPVMGPTSAQVATPQDHVFAGPGAGKSK